MMTNGIPNRGAPQRRLWFERGRGGRVSQVRGVSGIPSHSPAKLPSQTSLNLARASLLPTSVSSRSVDSIKGSCKAAAQCQPHLFGGGVAPAALCRDAVAHRIPPLHLDRSDGKPGEACSPSPEPRLKGRAGMLLAQDCRRSAMQQSQDQQTHRQTQVHCSSAPGMFPTPSR